MPAIVPSWRFFDTVTASPRVDYALLTASDEPVEQWREFRPRPAVLRLGTMLRRMLWNAQWNENLYLVSLAERLMSAGTEETAIHSQRELLLRVARHLDRRGSDHQAYLQIRLRLVSRADAAARVTSETVYLSGLCLMAKLLTP